MGVMENMLHSDSLRTVTSVNGSYSEGRLGKLAMDTGPSKPKRRSVSAVRDFPSGCGPLGNQIHSPEVSETLVSAKRLEQENVLTSEDKVVFSSDQGNEPESMKVEPVQIHSPVSEALNNAVLSEPVKVHSPVSEASNTAVLSEPVKDLEDAAFDLSKIHVVDASASASASTSKEEMVSPSSFKLCSPFCGPNDVPTGSGLKKTMAKNYASRRTVSAIRDFPLLCGRDAPRLSKEESLEELASLKNKSLRQDKSDMDDKPSEEMRKADVKRMGEDVQDGDAEKSELRGNVASLKNKSLCQDKSDMDDQPSEEMRKADVKRMGEDVQDGDAEKSELQGNVASLKNKSLCQDKSDMDDRPSEEMRKADVKRMGEDVQDGDAEKSELQGNVASLKNKSLCEDKSDMDDRPAEETRKADVKQMEEDVQDGDEQKRELQGNVSRITGDKIGAESDGCATKEIRKQDEFGMASEMKVRRDDTREKCTRPSSKSESNQHQSDRKSKTTVKKESRDIGGLEETKGKEIVVYGKDSSLKRKHSDISDYQIQLQEDFGSLEPVLERAVVQGLMAAPHCPWGQGKGAYKPYKAGVAGQSKGKTHNSLHLVKYKSAVKTKDKAGGSGVKLKKKSSITGNTANHGICQMVSRDKEDSLEEDDECKNFDVAPRPRSFGVNLPPFEQSASVKHHESDAITRSKVRETLRLFQAICRKLLQEDEANPKARGGGNKRIDLQASQILKKNSKYVNTGKQILGPVPGVEVGDEFHYRIELNIIGLHRQIQGGIDYVKQDGLVLATSIVASGGYADDLDNSDSLIYTGQGGNVMNAGKEPEDQKLERGNLALKNSMQERNPVRVIRGYDSSDGKMYFYDGLYVVVKCWQDLGPHGKLVFKFQLDRIPNQPELAWKEVKKSKKFKIREGLCVDDISQGKESIPICAVNTIDDEKPPPFKYITRVIYPDWCRPLPPKGCDCTRGCSDSEKCFCAVKNGGEIPFNHNGAIVEAKSLVYECGPSCKCSSSCPNRVTQHGIKFQLEIFKTKSRGWGVRSLNSIPSGSFICEYIGELLEEREADQRTGNDEYLFDIGDNYNDSSLWDGLLSLLPDAQASSCEVVVGDSGFTIDAAQYGNVGRFINHSCSPNLYAQNLLYDHADKRIPHIMFFAAENIPPLQELTYHYNYMIDQVHDSDGNIKKKSCFCGSIECTGRMY